MVYIRLTLKNNQTTHHIRDFFAELETINLYKATLLNFAMLNVPSR